MLPDVCGSMCDCTQRKIAPQLGSKIDPACYEELSSWCGGLPQPSGLRSGWQRQQYAARNDVDAAASIELPVMIAFETAA